MLGLALTASLAATTARAGVPPAGFVENQGQWDTDSAYVSRLGGMVTRLEKHAIVVQQQAGRGTGAVVRLSFEGAARSSILEGGRERRGVCNFLVGDRSTWRRGVPCYDDVFYRGLYDGVDVRVRESGGRPEYDLLLAPGADLGQVVIRPEGVETLAIEPDGSLVMHTTRGLLCQQPPVAWYEDGSGARRAVESSFCLIDETCFGFEVARRDAGLTLVIDPSLAWSTFIGGSEYDAAWSVVVDQDGMVTVAGSTASANFPTKPGAYDQTHAGTGSDGFGDCFVARFDPSATTPEDQLMWSTFLGGTDDENINNVRLDSDGTVVVGGWTGSSDFPTTPGAYSEVFNGVYDTFVARLSSDGSDLLWSTFLGGSDSDYAGAFRTMVLEESGMVTITGYTLSTDFPTTPGAFDLTYNTAGPLGWDNGYVSRLDPTQTGQDQLVYSTYLGGTGDEGGQGLGVHGDGLITVGGWTNSSNFPTTDGGFDTTYNGSGSNGGGDVFVARLDPAGNGADDLVYATYVGGSADEGANALVVDDTGMVSITGSVSSSDYPITPGAYNETYNGAWDAFVSRLSLDGNGAGDLVYSTFVGGSTNYDYGYNLDLNAHGDVVFTGATRSSDFPATPDSLAYGFGQDAFVGRMRLDGQESADMVMLSYLGGSNTDAGYEIFADNSNNLTVVGSTRSANFPVTPWAYDVTHNSPGVQDAFVTMLDLCPMDVDNDGEIGVTEFLDLLAAWGPCPDPCPPSCPTDFDGNCDVGIADFLILLANWGPCP
jgi:hypothetical protein